MTHSRLRKRLATILKKVIRTRKNDNVLKQKESLSIGNIMWIIQSQNSDLTSCLKAVCQNNELQLSLQKVESTINKLFNIFCSSYTIKNSFDIHFIVDNIDKMNSLSLKSRTDLSTILAELSSNPNLSDSSFNPFVNIYQTDQSFSTIEICQKSLEVTFLIFPTNCIV